MRAEFELNFIEIVRANILENIGDASSVRVIGVDSRIA
jgi:hypothetical protein